MRVGRCMEKVLDHQECPECSGVMMVNYNPKIDIERSNASDVDIFIPLQ